MRSDPLELVLDVGHVAARNLIRNHGEADGDTISEITRWVKDQIPAGDYVLALGLTGVGVGYWFHICHPGALVRAFRRKFST